MSTLQPAGPSAEAIATVWWWMLGVTGVVSLAVMAIWLVAMRSRRGHGEADASRHGRRWLIAGGVILPTVAIVALVVFGSPAGLHQLPLPGRSGADTLRIDVEAHQWAWSVHYPESGVRLHNELRLPVGRTALVHVRSRDVIHSFWVPRLGGKLDAIPGRTNVLRLQADEAGHFLGQCAEFCGLGHAHMRMDVHAMPPEAFAQWLQSQPRAQASGDDGEVTSTGASAVEGGAGR